MNVLTYVHNMPIPKKTSYLYSFTLWICVLNTALYSLKKTEFFSKSCMSYIYMYM